MCRQIYCGDGQYSTVTELHYDATERVYRACHGDLVVPEALFDQCVSAYMGQYRVTEIYARSLALSAYNWYEENGTIWYRV